MASVRSMLYLLSLAASVINVSAQNSSASITSNNPPSVTSGQAITSTITIGPDGAIVHVPQGTALATDISITGATTVTVTGIVANPGIDVIRTNSLYMKSTTTMTLDLGTLVVNVQQGTTYSATTLVAPTTVTLTASAPGNIRGAIFFAAETGKNDPACSLIGNTEIARPPSHVVELKSPVATLTTGQMLTTNVKNITDILGGFTLVPTVFSEPGIAYVTRTQTLSAMFTPPLGGNRPGERCGGSCKACSLYFESVYLHYWPTGTPNTACLTASAANTDQSRLKQVKHGIRVIARSIDPISDGATTIVNDQGFTFTSPSIYIAFPTISAGDDCGNIGSVHTSITLPFDASDISSAVLTEVPLSYAPTLSTISTGYFSFNFDDAHCMPQSLSGKNIWTVVGLDGEYNPVISAPPKLTMLDTAWNYGCSAAPFQGNDPPFALTPQAPMVVPTSSKPPPIPSPPMPGQNQPTPVAVTSRPNMDSNPSPTGVRPQPPAIPQNGDPSSPSNLPADPPKINDPTKPSPNPPNQDPSPNPPSAQAPNAEVKPTPIIISGQTFTPTPIPSSSGIIIAGQTLTPNGIITVAGTPISMSINPVGSNSDSDPSSNGADSSNGNPAGNAIIIIGAGTPTTSTQNIGDIIMSAFGGQRTNTPEEGGAGESVTPFTGAASTLLRGTSDMMWAWIGIASTMVLVGGTVL